VLAFGFTEKCQFVRKTDRNSIFYGPKAHIIDLLYIMVVCISFDWFKNTKFSSKSKVISLRFNQKMPVCGKKNWTKLRISWWWWPYFELVIKYCHLYNFLHVLNFLKFWLKIQMLAFNFTKKCQFVIKTNRNSIFIGREAHILNWL
jgi:hypothetical protein